MKVTTRKAMALRGKPERLIVFRDRETERIYMVVEPTFSVGEKLARDYPDPVFALCLDIWDRRFDEGRVVCYGSGAYFRQAIADGRVEILGKAEEVIVP